MPEQEEIPPQPAIRIVFDGEAAEKPIISKLVKDCGLDVNILSADIRQLNQKAYGQMLIARPQDPEDVKRVMEYLALEGLTVGGGACAMTWDQLLPMLWEGTVETLYMTLWSSAIAYLIGLPLGVLLVVTRRGGIMPAVTFNAILGVAINFLRSIPFVIMIAVLFPVTRLVMGSSIGTRSVIFPLVISAFPYIARMVESSLAEVDHGIIEAAQSMGSTNRQIIFKVLLPEALPSLVNGAAISITTILGYTALASTIGGGGLGTLAIVKGLNIRKYDMMYSASLMLVFLVQIITVFGTRTTRSLDHKHR